MFGQLSKSFDARLVTLKRVNVILEALNPLLELMLLEDNLTQFPLSIFSSMLLFVHMLRLVVVKCFMSDFLAKVNILKTLVQVLNLLVDFVINDHTWSHEA